MTEKASPTQKGAVQVAIVVLKPGWSRSSNQSTVNDVTCYVMVHVMTSLASIAGNIGLYKGKTLKS